MLTGAAASVSPSQDGLQLKVCFQVMPVLFSLYNSIQMLGCKSELWVGWEGGGKCYSYDCKKEALVFLNDDALLIWYNWCYEIPGGWITSPTQEHHLIKKYENWKRRIFVRKQRVHTEVNVTLENDYLICLEMPHSFLLLVLELPLCSWMGRFKCAEFDRNWCHQSGKMTVQVQHLITEWKSNSEEAVQHKLYVHRVMQI